MGIFSSSIFNGGNQTTVHVYDGGYPYYYVENTKDILVDNFQQYSINNRAYIDVAGKIEIAQSAEIIIVGV